MCQDIVMSKVRCFILLMAITCFSSWHNEVQASSRRGCEFEAIISKVLGAPSKLKNPWDDYGKYVVRVALGSGRLPKGNGNSRYPQYCKKKARDIRGKVYPLILRSKRHISRLQPGGTIRINYIKSNSYGQKATERWIYIPTKRKNPARKAKSKTAPGVMPKARVKAKMQRWLKANGHKIITVTIKSATSGKRLRLVCEKGQRCDENQKARKLKVETKMASLTFTFRKSIWKAKEGADLKAHISDFGSSYSGPSMPFSHPGWEIQVNAMSGAMAGQAKILKIKLKKGRIKGIATMRYTYLDALFVGDAKCKANEDPEPPARCSVSLRSALRIKFIFDLEIDRTQIDCTKLPHNTLCE